MTTELSLPFATLPEWFEHQARTTPDAIAVVAEETAGPREITFSELNRRANRLARRLEKIGVGPDTLVALSL
jgi:non-ribosomal peptide synthetase component F